MASIFDNLQDLVSPAIHSYAARQTGESEAAAAKGLKIAIHMVAAKIASRWRDRGFLTEVVDLATAAARRDSFTDVIGVQGTATLGEASGTPASWPSSLFGAQVSEVTDAIGRYAGVRGTSAVSLVSMAVSLVLSSLGRVMRRDNLDVTGLADQLRLEEPRLAGALPASLDDPGVVRPPRDMPLSSTTSTPPDTEPLLRERIPDSWNPALLALVGLVTVGGALSWWVLRSNHQVARVETTYKIEGAIGTAGTTTRDTNRDLDTLFSRSLPGNVTPLRAHGSPEDRLSKYLSTPGARSIPVDFDQIAFETGSATLTRVARAQVDNIAAVLRVYPKTRITVTGHTDNIGGEDANVTLSRARAEAVASLLKEDGVAANRLSAEGFGSQQPIADNSIDAGRAANRRVTLEVMVK